MAQIFSVAGGGLGAGQTFANQRNIERRLAMEQQRTRAAQLMEQQRMAQQQMQFEESIKQQNIARNFAAAQPKFDRFGQMLQAGTAMMDREAGEREAQAARDFQASQADIDRGIAQSRFGAQQDFRQQQLGVEQGRFSAQQQATQGREQRLAEQFEAQQAGVQGRFQAGQELDREKLAFQREQLAGREEENAQVKEQRANILRDKEIMRGYKEDIGTIDAQIEQLERQRENDAKMGNNDEVIQATDKLQQLETERWKVKSQSRQHDRDAANRALQSQGAEPLPELEQGPELPRRDEEAELRRLKKVSEGAKERKEEKDIRREDVKKRKLVNAAVARLKTTNADDLLDTLARVTKNDPDMEAEVASKLRDVPQKMISGIRKAKKELSFKKVKESEEALKALGNRRAEAAFTKKYGVTPDTVKRDFKSKYSVDLRTGVRLLLKEYEGFKSSEQRAVEEFQSTSKRRSSREGRDARVAYAKRKLESRDILGKLRSVYDTLVQSTRSSTLAPKAHRRQIQRIIDETRKTGSIPSAKSRDKSVFGNAVSYLLSPSQHGAHEGASTLADIATRNRMQPGQFVAMLQEILENPDKVDFDTILSHFGEK